MRKYSEACEQNKGPILSILKHVFKDCNTVLEIGSGTGQHAVYFSKQLPYLSWQPSDLAENLPSIQAWIDEEPASNLKTPLELDVCNYPWSINPTEAIFSANTFHIMSWEMVEHFFKRVGEVLDDKGVLFVYGPFSYQGRYTSLSNERFDQYLRQRDPLSGIKDFVEIEKLANSENLELLEDYAMPVNNRSLVWKNIK